MKNNELITIFLILSLGFLLVLPIPAKILDYVITINIGLSVLILASCLFTIRIHKLLIFPTVLLILTLLRIATNVATTRMILTEAYAGEIINTFGKILIQGDVVVGLIIFVLISLVALVVISRGTARISEVAARFTLDAMPNRQLAIEHEFKAGEISFKEAQQKREELKRESMLYGAMEGAMKFIQGDAVISIITVIINFCGGIFIGMRNKLTFSQALEKYSLLTVGDGLVAQIPALFLAISAGIIVSRVSSLAEEGVVSEAIKNILSKKETAFVTGLILLALGLMPGIPTESFLVVGTGFLILSIFLHRHHSKALEKQVLDNCITLDIGNKELVSTTIEKLQKFSQNLSSSFSNLLNLRVPTIQINVTEGTGFILKSKNRRWEIQDLGSDKEILNLPLYYFQIFKDKEVSEIRIPIMNMKGILVPTSEKVKKFTSALEISSISNLEYVILKSYEIILSNTEIFIDVTTVSNMLRDLTKSFPDFDSIINSERFFSLTKISSLIRLFLKNNLTVNSLPLFLEILNNICLRFNQTKYDDSLSVDDVFTVFIEESNGVLEISTELMFDVVRFMIVKDAELADSILDRNRKYGSVPLIPIPDFDSDSDIERLKIINHSKKFRSDPFALNCQLNEY